MGVRARLLDDRIRELAEAVAAKSSHRVRPILAELSLAIHQYTQRLRNRAAAILTGCSDFPLERRKTSRDRRHAPIPNPPRIMAASNPAATPIGHYLQRYMTFVTVERPRNFHENHC
jgi:hypothetical protein